MSPATLLPFVEKFPAVSPEERALLLEWARTTDLNYGAWKPFKSLFKSAEASLKNGQIDIELMGVLLHRVDGMNFSTSSTRWKAVDATLSGEGDKSVAGNGFKYTVGARNSYYDYTGWRLVIEPQESGVLAGLRRALGFEERAYAKSIAFELDARDYIYGIKKIGLSGGLLTISCGSTWNEQQFYNYVVDVSDPNFIHLQSAAPTTATVQYMKRRARRVLRDLSKDNPDYIALATQLLREHGAKSLNAATNWAAFDVLFAQSPRWKQTQPGRGAYKNLGGFVRLRREERAPQIWDAHETQLRELFADKNVPLEATEMAFKALRNKAETEYRVLDVVQLTRFLNGDSALLQSVATRVFADAIASGQTVDGALWAQLVLKSNARHRRSLLEKTDDAELAARATPVFVAALDGKQATKKRRAAATLVARFADQISDDVMWKHLETFADVNEESKSWVFVRIADSARRGEFARLAQVSRLREDLRDAALQTFSEAAQNAQPTVEQSLPLVATADQANNAVGWRFLAATQMTQENARQLWYRVWDFEAPFLAQIHETAAQNDGALQIFERADFSAEKLEKRLPQVPAFVAALSSAFFASIFRRVSASKQIELALSANDEQWRGAREVLLQTLENDEQRGAFWNRVLELATDEANAETLRRIVDDDEISATFARTPPDKIAALLERTDPTLEPWLARWLDANLASLHRGDSALLFAAISPLAEIRRRGLARLETVGLDLPLALRLMESGLPQPFEVARAWFETHQELDLADRALALCDSPDASVRAFGRTFLETHRDRVLDASLLKKLTENADPQMQAWLAEHLLKDAQSVEVAVFDQSVLRARGRARRAKEAVKTRRDATQKSNIEYSNDEIATLLDVARGRTRRDREWALQQLAQVALSGREIDGVSVL